MTNAACQLEQVSLAEAKEKLLNVLNEILESGGVNR